METIDASVAEVSLPVVVISGFLAHPLSQAPVCRRRYCPVRCERARIGGGQTPFSRAAPFSAWSGLAERLVRKQEMIDAALLALSMFFIIGTVLPFIRNDAWVIRIFDFPRAQIALGGLITAGLVYARGDTDSDITGATLALLLGCVSYQGYRMYPYTWLAPRQVRTSVGPNPAACISLLLANVLQENRNAAGLLALVQAYDPDLVLAVETDHWWAARLRALADRYPYIVQVPLENCYGMLLASRLKLVRPEVKFLVEPDVPSIHTAVALPSGTLVRLYCLHPRPPHPPTGQDTTERDAELLVVGREVAQLDQPAIVAGDLNDVAWSHTTTLFQKISRMLDPRVGRGMYNTFSAKIPLMRWPLDHVFHSRQFGLVTLKRLPAFGSDHFPVYVKLCHDPGAAARQDAPRATPGDQAEATEKIAKAGQSG